MSSNLIKFGKKEKPTSDPQGTTEREAQMKTHFSQYRMAASFAKDLHDVAIPLHLVLSKIGITAGMGYLFSTDSYGITEEYMPVTEGLDIVNDELPFYFSIRHTPAVVIPDEWKPTDLIHINADRNAQLKAWKEANNCKALHGVILAPITTIGWINDALSTLFSVEDWSNIPPSPRMKGIQVTGYQFSLVGDTLTDWVWIDDRYHLTFSVDLKNCRIEHLGTLKMASEEFDITPNCTE